VRVKVLRRAALIWALVKAGDADVDNRVWRRRPVHDVLDADGHDDQQRGQPAQQQPVPPWPGQDAAALEYLSQPWSPRLVRRRDEQVEPVVGTLPRLGVGLGSKPLRLMPLVLILALLPLAAPTPALAGGHCRPIEAATWLPAARSIRTACPTSRPAADFALFCSPGCRDEFRSVAEADGEPRRTDPRPTHRVLTRNGAISTG
jgi:hypothetical protein